MNGFVQLGYLCGDKFNGLLGLGVLVFGLKNMYMALV